MIPDVIRSWNNNSIIEIRNPQAIRPWQHVLEPLSGYLFLAEDTYSNLELCSSYNFGPYKKDIASVEDVLDMAKIIIKDLEIKYQTKQVGLHEAKLLSLDISKSESILNFKPRWSIKESVKKTIDWYQRLAKGDSASSLCELDIAEFESEPIRFIEVLIVKSPAYWCNWVCWKTSSEKAPAKRCCYKYYFSKQPRKFSNTR